MISNQVNFIYDWGRVERPYCWSGTPYGIYKALMEMVNVNDCPVQYSAIQSGQMLLQRFYNYFTHTSDFYIQKTRLGEKNIDFRMKLNKDIPSLMFLEYNTKMISNSYVFQDLSVDFLARYVSGYPDICKQIGISLEVTHKKLQKRINMTRKFYQECKGIFTMSEWLRNDLIKNTGISQEKIYCVGGGSNIDITRIQNINKNGKRFLFAGKDFYRKNGDLTVKAFSKLRGSYPDIELYIVGPQNMPKEIADKQGIYFIGRIPYDKVADYYSLCDYFVMPSRFEAYGLVFAEALICGLPCIGKNIFAMPEFISQGKNGYLIEKDDVEELCIAMEKLLMNGERIKAFIEGKRNEYKKKYSWTGVAKKILEVFERDGY